MRQNFPDGTPLEGQVGYSRAVRAGDMVFVSGTVAWDKDGRVDPASGMYAQTRQAIANIEEALMRAGATLEDVVRTRIFTVDAASWEEIARAHREAFASIAPASTLVEVSRLAAPEMLVEVEADAVVPPPAG